MSNQVHLFAIVLGSTLGLSALLCNLTAWPLIHLLRKLAPEMRSQLLLLVALSPWLFSTGVMTYALPDLLFGACDMGTRCLWVGNISEMRPYVAPISMLPFIPHLVVAIRLLWQFFLSRRALSTLDQISLAQPNRSLTIVPGEHALAFVGRGRIYLSDALRQKLSAEQVQAIQLHEEAHLLRHDSELMSVARLASALIIPGLRKLLLRELELSNEECCDDHAVKKLGATTVASAILTVERAASQLGRQPALKRQACFANSYVAQRVRSLLLPVRRSISLMKLQMATLVAILSVFFLADVMYYASLFLLYPDIM